MKNDKIFISKEEIIVESEIISYKKRGRKKRMELTDQIYYDALEDIDSNVKFFAIYNGHGVRGMFLAEYLKKDIKKIN